MVESAFDIVQINQETVIHCAAGSEMMLWLSSCNW